MFKNLFGPFPDEPLLYTFDKILGLFHRFDTKSNCKYAKNQSDPIVPIVEKVDDVIDDKATKNEATMANELSLQISETTGITPKQSTTDNLTIVEASKANEIPEIVPQPQHNSTPRSILKTSSSMECNYTLSKINVAKESVQTKPETCTKKVNSCTKLSTKKYTQTNKGFGDSMAVVENTFERKLFKSDGKHRFESIMKEETKQRSVVSSPHTNTDRVKRWNNEPVREQTGRHRKPNKSVKLPTDRKVIKTEWAVTRIYTFDDDSQTYEVMKKDKVLEKNGGIERIFAIAPNLTTVAYEPLKGKAKIR